MIEIIKRGTKRTTKCECCGCEFRFEDEDTHIEFLGEEEVQYVQCPQCDEQVILKQTR